MSDERQAFEQLHAIPNGAEWCEKRHIYIHKNYSGLVLHPINESWEAFCEGALWQASREALSSCSEIPNSSGHASRQAASVPEWIKCSERMPESGITVLVSNNSGAIYTCRRSVIERKNLEPDGADFTRERFTHWMPLPDPLKQEQGQ